MTGKREPDEVDEATSRDLRELFAAPRAAPLAKRPAADPLPFLTVDPEWEPPPESQARRRWVLGGVVGLATAGAMVGGRLLLSGATANEPMTFQPGPSAILATDSVPWLPAPERVESAGPPSRLYLKRTPSAAPSVLAPLTSPAAPPPMAPGAPLLRRRRGPGRLFINATPWGEVYVDDVLVGNTPRPDLSVPAGIHRLRVTRDGYQPFELTIQVAPGDVVRLTDIVLKALVP